MSKELSANTTLSHYRIINKLGAGGMGEVYLAQDTSELGRKVALKILPSEVAGDKDRLQRFIQEARTVSNLNHPNILTVHEFGKDASSSFMATEYGRIPYRVDGIPIGIQKPADDEGEFEYICAAEVSKFGDPLPELVRIEIPSRRCAVFEHRGHVSTVGDTYAAIWNEALYERGWAPANAPVIERHSPSFDPETGDGGLSLWIPLAD